MTAPQIIEARRVMDRVILADMHSNGSSCFRQYDFFHRLSTLGDPRYMTREMVRAICRSLTDRGFAHYQRGLFTEDGEVAGAGYGITRLGLAYLMALEEIS